MLRISLIIAIVAGLAAAGLNFYKVREVIVTTMAERDQEKTEKEASQKLQAETKKKLDKTDKELASTTKTLKETESSLKKETAHAAQQEKEAKSLATKLSKSEGERDTAQRELVQWQTIRMKPEEIKGVIAERKQFKEDKEILSDENMILARSLKKVKAELASLIGDDVKPPAMPGVKGTIVAVDPKYDFVVLDIGASQGALEKGELLVNRSGKLVAKIKIFSVEPNRCIANIMANWKQGEVMEGDQVLY
ncbi:MAG: hypothetical protein JWM68_4087 [Verrucomicrobiales bacterium]|nr:hypothetical protein [Verrucomicrobiales bacterium]